MADRLAKVKGREPVEARVGSLGVVVDPPELERVPGCWQALEQVLVQAFVAQPADQALDQAVLHRLARRDIVPGNAALLLPGEDRMRGQLGAVVADDHQRQAAQLGDAVELTGDAMAGQRAIGDQRQALPAEVVDHHQNPQAPAVAQDVRGEVEAPALVRCLWHRQRRPGAERALAAAALPDRQPLLAVEPEQPLVVDHDAFAPQQDQQAAIAEATPLGRQLAQPAAAARPRRDDATDSGRSSAASPTSPHARRCE